MLGLFIILKKAEKQHAWFTTTPKGQAWRHCHPSDLINPILTTIVVLAKQQCSVQRWP